MHPANAAVLVVAVDNVATSFGLRRSFMPRATAQLRPSLVRVCGIRSKAAGNSDPFQPLIPRQTSHPFRSKPATR